MTELDPYPGITHDDRAGIRRLRSAAKAGDRRAEATLAHLEQQQHDAAWKADDDARLAAEEERRQRHAVRPLSIAATRERRQKQRDEKAAQARADRDAAASAIAKRKSQYGW